MKGPLTAVTPAKKARESSARLKTRPEAPERSSGEVEPSRSPGKRRSREPGGELQVVSE